MQTRIKFGSLERSVRIVFRLMLSLITLLPIMANATATDFEITARLLPDSNTDLQAHTLLLHDPNNELTVEQAVDEFLQRDGLQQELDPAAQHYWFFTPLINRSSEPSWTIRSNNVLYDQVRFYQYCEGQEIQAIERPELGLASANLSTSFYVNLEIPSGTACGFVQQASVAAFYPVQTYLMPTASVLAQSNLHTVLNLIGLGIIIGLIIYNLLLSTSLRSSTYLLYTLYASMHFLLLLLVATRHTVIELPGWSSVQWFRFLSSSLMVVFILLTLKFIGPGFQQAQTGRMGRVAQGISLTLKRLAWVPIGIMAGFAAEAVFWPQHLGQSALIYPPTYIICSLFIPAISLSSALAGYRPAWVFLSAWSILIATHILGTLDLIGVIELHGWSRTQAVLGGASEMILLSIALGMSLSESQAARQRSRLAREQAELITQERGKFLSTVSHEIRTPLHAMLGASDLLGKTPLSEQQQRYWSATHYAAESLYALADNLLDRNQPSQNQNESSFDPTRLIEAMVQLLRHRADEKGLHVETVFNACGDTEIPPLLKGNPVIVRRLLINLISNAVKYTHSGSISVRSDWNAADRILTITVQDSGIGMTSAQLQKVKSSLTQRVEFRYASDPSSGLGLSICQELVDGVGGTLNIESGLNGTSVKVRLPMRTITADDSHADVENGQTYEVLVVDDVDSNRMIAAELLGQAGHNIVQATSGDEALLIIQNQTVDVVLSDLIMPGMNGERLLQQIRQSPETQHIRFILSSAHLSAEVEERISHWGNTVCLPKPYSGARLFRCLSPEQAYIPQALDTRKAMDFNATNLEAELGSPKFETLVALYNKQLLVDKERILLGLKAGLVEEIKIAAHRVVSASETLGVVDNAGLAARIEDAMDSYKDSPNLTDWKRLASIVSAGLEQIQPVSFDQQDQRK